MYNFTRICKKYYYIKVIQYFRKGVIKRMYKDLDKFRKELKQWRKERLISICKEYEVEQNEEQLKAITNREIIDYGQN